MSGQQMPKPRGGGFAFLIISWLVLALASGGGVWWLVSDMSPQTQQVVGKRTTDDKQSTQPTGPAEPTGETPADSTQPAQSSAEPTSQSTGSDSSRSSTQRPRSTSTGSSSSRASSSSTSRTSSSSTTTAFDPPAPEHSYSGYVTIVASCYKEEAGKSGSNACSYDELVQTATNKVGAGQFEILDSNNYPEFNRDAWAAVAKGVSWGSEQEASDYCATFGLAPGPSCYGRYTGY